MAALDLPRAVFSRFVFDLALVLAMVLDTWVLLAIMASSEPLFTTRLVAKPHRASATPAHANLRTWMFRL